MTDPEEIHDLSDPSVPLTRKLVPHETDTREIPTWPDTDEGDE